ncbi:MAG: CBS domain-containing protein [Candidatus Omnitrophica bacterium]|nr:CBS domain-containing protein [Candidatus Omnitrophota bacterium]
MRINDLMTKSVLTVSPEHSLRDVGKLMKEARISGVPVVDEAKKIIGIVTLTDLEMILERLCSWEDAQDTAMLRIFQSTENPDPAWKGNLAVKDVMSKDVVVVNADQTVDEVRRMMFKLKKHTFPVVKDNTVIGIVGQRDLIYSCF